MESVHETKSSSRLRNVPMGLALLVAVALAAAVPVVSAADQSATSTAWESDSGGTEHREARQAEWGGERRAAARGTGGVRDAFVTLSALGFVDVLGLGTSPFSGDLSRLCQGLVCNFVAGLPVPHGATIVGAEIDACDDDAVGGKVSLEVLRVAGNEGGLESLSDEIVAGPGCSYTYSDVGPHVVDQYLDHYAVLVSIAGGDVDERFQAVRVYYRSGDGEVIPTGTEPSLFP